jgi:putative flippase GtrA
MSKLISIKLVKYGVVGISGIGVDFFITWLCKEKLKWNKYIANIVGFSAAVVTNFLLNKYWTFQQGSTKSSHQLIQFILVSIAGLLINTTLLYLV